MWETAEEAGLSKEEISKICNKLWEKEKTSKRDCPDCAVKPNKQHDDGCDVARCLKCNGQALSCDCKHPHIDVWTGIWPGIRECYAKKLLSRFGKKGEWSFDLNREAVISMESKRKK
jgi:hypothetical protein